MKKFDGEVQLNKELQRICNMDLPESELIGEKLNMAYRQIYEKAEREGKAGGKKKMKKNRLSLVKLAAMAAGVMIVICGGIGVANPALAVDIPIIGKIFTYLEEKVSYPGDYSENTIAVGIQDQENSSETQETAENGQGKE